MIVSMVAEQAKPGYRTTEFWFSLGAAVGGLLVTLGVWSPSDNVVVQETVQTAATAVTGAVVVSYGAFRAIVKAFPRR